MDEKSGRRLARSTAIFSLATGLSRILGLVREVVASYYFGAAGKINAFTVAFQVPNLIRALVADAALQSAFVPVFTELLEKGDRKRAWRVASSLFWLVLLILSGLTALFIVLAPWIIGLFGDPGGDKQLAIGLSRVLFPIVTLLGVSGIVVGILNSYERFTVPALSPVFWNVAIIVGLVIGVPRADSIDGKLYVYAVSIVIGTVIQVLLPMPWLRGLDGRLHMVIDWRDPAVARVLKLMLPVTLGLGLINFNAVVDSIFASRLIDPELAPTAIDRAFRLYMLPQGIFSVAITTVLFPSLSRLAARGDQAGFRNTLALGLRQIAFLLIPASVVSALLAEPITRLVYERGAFESAQTPVVAGALAAFSAGLFFNGVDAAAQPRVLQPAVELDPHRRRTRKPRPQRRARRRLLPLRHLGPSARDIARQRRGQLRLALPDATPARPHELRRDCRLRAADRSRIRRFWRVRPTGRGQASITRWDARSRANSSRFWRHSELARSSTSLRAERSRFASSGRC